MRRCCRPSWGSASTCPARRRIAARGELDRGQLQRLAAATAGFSPAFLVGGVGAGMLNSAAAGWKLAGAQLLTQIALLALLGRCREARPEPVAAAGIERQTHPIRGAVQGVLTICGYMALFGALTGALGKWVDSGASDVLLCLLDVPSGALRIAGLALSDSVMEMSSHPSWLKKEAVR